MKFSTLIEGRSNPEKNPKTKILSELEELQKKLRNDGDLLANGFTNGFVSFAELIKIGFNPSPKDETTPAALYSYPLDYVIYQMKRVNTQVPAKSGIPYASNFPYLNVFSIKDKTKILFINDSVNHEKTRGIPASPETTSEPEFVERIKASDLKSHFTDGDNVFLRFMIAVQRHTSEIPSTKSTSSARVARAYTTWLHELGIDCVFDAGFGQIAEPEPVQALFISGAVTETIKTIVNKPNIPGNTKLKYAKHGKNLDLPNRHVERSTARSVLADVYHIMDHDLMNDNMSEQDLFTIFKEYFSKFDPAEEYDCTEARIPVEQVVRHGFAKSLDDSAMDFSDVIRQLKYFAKVFSIFKTCAKMYNARFGNYFDLSDIQSDIIHIKQVTKFYHFMNVKLKSTQYMKLISVVREAENIGEIEKSLQGLFKFLMPHLDAMDRIDLVNRLKIMVGRALEDKKQFELHRFNNILVINKVSNSLINELYDELMAKYKKRK